MAFSAQTSVALVAQFESSLRLVGDTDTDLPAVVALENGRLRMTSGPHEIGDWTLEELSISYQPDGFHFRVEGEEMIVTISDPAAFAEALDIGEEPERLKEDRPKRKRFRTERAPRKPRGKELVARAKTTPLLARFGTVTGRLRSQALPGRSKVKMLWARFKSLPTQWQVSVYVAAALVVLGILYPGTMAVLLLITGMLTLIIGALALTDDPLVYSKLPSNVSEHALLGAGLGMIAVSVILILIS